MHILRIFCAKHDVVKICVARFLRWFLAHFIRTVSEYNINDPKSLQFTKNPGVTQILTTASCSAHKINNHMYHSTSKRKT